MIPVIRPWLGEEEAAAAAAAVASGWIAQGPRVAQFEEAFAAAIGADHAVAVSSCTTALHLAMVAAGVGPGDEVIVPSLSFIATANAVRYVGARPVFADVELDTQNLTAETVAGAADRPDSCGHRCRSGRCPSRHRRDPGAVRATRYQAGARLGVRRRVRVPRPPGWCRSMAGHLLVPPAQASYDGRRRHDRHVRRSSGGTVAPPA